jgi:hypothetical protein
MVQMWAEKEQRGWQATRDVTDMVVWLSFTENGSAVKSI